MYAQYVRLVGLYNSPKKEILIKIDRKNDLNPNSNPKNQFSLKFLKEILIKIDRKNPKNQFSLKFLKEILIKIDFFINYLNINLYNNNMSHNNKKKPILDSEKDTEDDNKSQSTDSDIISGTFSQLDDNEEEVEKTDSEAEEDELEEIEEIVAEEAEEGEEGQERQAGQDLISYYYLRIRI